MLQNFSGTILKYAFEL